MRMTEEQYQQFLQRCGRVPSTEPKMKYSNVKVKTDDGKFDSKKELARFRQLQMMEKAGAITGLKRQVPFELVPAVKLNGKQKPAMKYVADFVYDEMGKTVVEDSKGMITDVFRIKQHLMKHVHGIEIILT